MRTIKHVVTALTVAALAVGGGLAAAGSASAHSAPAHHNGPPVSAAPVVQNGVSESARAWATAVTKGDLDAIRVLYGPGTTAFGPSGAAQLKGDKANVDNYAGLFGAFTAKVTFTDAHYFWAGETLNSFGLFRLTLTPKAGGAPTVINGRFSDVAVQVHTQWGNGWRYLVDHSSVPAA